tara:strand:+ start:2259 stop:3857 length:1599 start_codon:yes stop_codon:yes gene_type:complete
MSPATSEPSKDTTSRIYKDGYQDCDVTGLPFSYNFEFTPNKITTHLMQLHDKMNQGDSTQVEIDRHWLPLMMTYCHSPLLDVMPWQAFLLKPEHVLQACHLPDIGMHVRTLSMRHDSTQVMCRMIQYSLPYIKHNRLTFPKFTDINNQTLVGLIQIVLAMCLGMHSETIKKPVWQLRFRIVTYMYTLLTTGTEYDLYLWCVNNLNLIRIAIVEYFVSYVQQHMPCEYDILRILFGVNTNVEHIFRQFQLNINYFRSNHLQGEHLLWSELNDRAHIIIEKCNRICKGKPRIASLRRKRDMGLQAMSHKAINLGLAMPRCHSIFALHTMMPKLSVATLRSITDLQSSIQVQVLPRSITKRQCTRLHQALFQDTHLYANSVFLHRCIKCRSSASDKHVGGQLRTDADGIVSCCHCKTADTVVSINALGRIIQCYDKKYYYCSQCLTIHEWTGTGHEFTQCLIRAPAPEPTEKQCLLCTRVHNLHNMSILDDNLGIKQHFLLCGRHVPWLHQQPLIYNMDSLLKAIQFKIENSSYV